MNLDQALAEYLDAMRARHLSDRTIESANTRIGRFIARYPDLELRAVTSADINEHFLALRESGLSDGTLAGHKTAHRTFWKWCLKEGYIESDPSSVLSSGRHRYSFRPVHSRAAPVDSLHKVISSLAPFAAHRDQKPRDIRDAALVSITIDSSARRGEIHNLRRIDIDYALTHGQQTKSGQSVYHATAQGKTGPANIRFFDQTAVLLTLWLQQLDELQPETRWLWVSLRTGKRLRIDIMKLAFERICEFAGVPPFRFHAVRKRNVTDIIEMTGDQKAGQLYAGHSDERTTQRYYNEIEQSRVDESAAQLSSRRRSSKDDNDDLLEDFFRRLTGG